MEDAQKFNFKPMLSKKSLHMASQMKSAKTRLLEKMENDLQKQQIYENIECKR